MSDRREVLNRAMSITGLYSIDELEALYDLAEGLPIAARIVEIGVAYGRSASIFLSLSKRKQFDLHFIDPFVLNAEHTPGSFVKTAHSFGVPFTLHVCRSYDCKRINYIDLLHVDGDHDVVGIRQDCLWLEMVKAQRFAVFHDYVSEDYPHIRKVVDEETQGWTRLGITERQARFMKA